VKGGIEFGREAIGVASNAIHILHSGPHALASGLEGAGRLSDVDAWKMKAMACCKPFSPVASSHFTVPFCHHRYTTSQNESLVR